MARFFTLLFIFFSFSLAFGQLNEPLVGVAYNTSKKENFSGFIGENVLSTYTADYIFYSKRKQELIIRSFHKGDLQLTNSTDLYSVLDEGFTNEPEEIFYTKNQFYLFSKMFSERDKTVLLALEVFDENFERISYEILDTLKNDEIQYIEESTDKDGFLIAKHLRFTQLVEQEIELKYVDTSGKLSWKKTLKSPMALQNLRIENIKFQSSGNIYLLCNYAFDMQTADNLSGDQLVNNKYAIWAYNPATQFLKEFEIRLKGKWVNGVDMKIISDNSLQIAGYFNETKNQTINGVFGVQISEKLEVSNTSWHKFEPSTMALFAQKEKNKKPKELENFVLKELAIMDDGSYYLIGEQYYKYIERSYDPRTNVTTTTEHYNYNSIITSYFNTKGQHQWTMSVPKYQSSTNDFGYFSSFSTFNSGEDIFLIFNDNEKNNAEAYSTEKEYTNLFNNRKFQISYAHATKDGVQDRGAVLKGDNDYILRAKMSGQVNSNSIYLITETNRSSRIIQLEVTKSQ